MATPAIKRNDQCPCGSGQKYKRCHDPKRRESPEWVGSYAVQPRLFKLLLAALELLAEVAPRKFSVNVGEDRYNQECVAVFHAAMLHSAASAIGTLVAHGSVREAFGLRRKMISALLNLQYYIQNPKEATLFTASQPLKRFRTLSLHEGLTPDQLKDLRDEVDAVLRVHPEVGAWQADGSLKQAWNEKSDSEKRDILYPTIDIKRKATIKLVLEDLSSQDLHNTAFALGNAISVEAKNGEFSVTFDRRYRRGNYLLREAVLAVLSGIELLVTFRNEVAPSRYHDIRKSVDLFEYDEELFKD